MFEATMISRHKKEKHKIRITIPGTTGKYRVPFLACWFR